jgi:hypothetical protein
MVMEQLVAAFSASLTMSGKDNHAAHPGGAADQEPCVLRVRFPEGRVLCESFGAGRPTTELYQYCRSVLLAGGATARGAAFRLVTLAGGASEEVRVSSSTSFRDLGLHHCTVHVVLD